MLSARKIMLTQNGPDNERLNTMNRCALKVKKACWASFTILAVQGLMAADGFYVAHRNASNPLLGRIDYVNAAGNVSGFYAGPGVPLTLAWDGSTYLYASVGDTIQRFGLDGTSTTFASGLNAPAGLAFDGNGNLFVANYSGGTISKITLDGTVSSFATGLELPSGLAFDRDGNLYCAERNNTSLSVFAPDGTPSTFGSGLEDPQQLVFDTEGNLYVSIYGNNTPTTDTIARITPDGTVTTFASGLRQPTALVFDSNGDLFVANRLGNGINRITPNGENTVFVSGLRLPTGLAAGPAPLVPEPSSIAMWVLFSGLGCFWFHRKPKKPAL